MRITSPYYLAFQATLCATGWQNVLIVLYVNIHLGKCALYIPFLSSFFFPCQNYYGYFLRVFISLVAYCCILPVIWRNKYIFEKYFLRCILSRIALLYFFHFNHMKIINALLNEYLFYFTIFTVCINMICALFCMFQFFIKKIIWRDTSIFT